jgi:dipeptidyl aminopeptidase/acylaminoacyl peptidase
MRHAPIALAMLSLIFAPTVASAQQAGALIAADPVVDTPAGMQAWRVRYWTSDATGRPREVTGMVVAPREASPARARPVLAWTHGTWGVASRCAPSLSKDFWSGTAGLGAVKHGYVVVAPDYPGLGSAGMHPFLVGEDTARSVIDGVRAARSIPGAGAGSRYAVWGESQGGHAALWTAQSSRKYAPDLTLVGAAAAAPPTDLANNLRATSNRALKSFFTAYIGRSWSAHYGAPLSSLGNRQTQGIITRLADNNCISLNMKPKLGMVLGISVLNARLKAVDIGRIEPWAGLARRNSPSTASIGVPLLIAQNAKDDLVAPAVTAAHVRALCRSGNKVRSIAISGEGHATSARDSAAATLAWIADRFAGKPAPSDCGRG